MTPDKSAFNKTPPGGCQTDDLYLIHGLFRNAFRHAPLMVSSASQADPGRVSRVAARVLSQAEWDEAQKRGMAETPKERLFFTLGYLRRGAPTEALRADFWGKLPLPARLIYRLFWKKKFEREWADLNGQAQ